MKSFMTLHFPVLN